jgi:DNA-binding transcriptional LysR family regulator
LDRLTSLIVFGRVVEDGGFSAAARRLSMSVTMVSNHIQALEDRLGARLLNRTTRKVSLTEVGKAYYDRSTQILADLDEADRVAGELQATPQGTLHLHTNSAMVSFLAPVVSEYMTLYPAVSIELSVGERMVDLIEEGIDLAIRTLPPPDSSLIVRSLTPWRPIVCCAPSYLEKHGTLRHVDDLKHHNCLHYEFYPYGREWRFIGPMGEAVSIHVGGNFTTNSGDMLRRLALAGHGVFMAPSFMVADDIRAGRLVRTLTDYTAIDFTISAIYPHRHHLSTKVRSFIDLLAERFAEHRRWANPNAVD